MIPASRMHSLKLKTRFTNFKCQLANADVHPGILKIHAENEMLQKFSVDFISYCHVNERSEVFRKTLLRELVEAFHERPQRNF